MSWLHIRNATVFAPQELGKQDVLCWGGRIVSVGNDLRPPQFANPDVADAKGQILLPGLIDAHIHIMGASGSGGPAERSSDLPLSRITSAGVTTVASPLGTDSISRTLHGLLMRAKAATDEGIDAYVYTGGWTNPVPTFTGDPQSDVVFLDRVLGIKVAIAEASAPPLSVQELAHLAHASIIGGRLAGKNSVLHAHIGDRSEGLQPLREAASLTGLPLDRFVATHINRNATLHRQALDFAKAGGSIDFTSQVHATHGSGSAIPPSLAILQALDDGVPPDRITLSSDSGGTYPRLDGSGLYMADPSSVFQTLSEIVNQGRSWCEAAAFSTLNPARLLGLAHKGRIAEEADADLLLLDENGRIDKLWSRGRLMVSEGKPIVHSHFES